MLFVRKDKKKICIFAPQRKKKAKKCTIFANNCLLQTKTSD